MSIGTYFAPGQTLPLLWFLRRLSHFGLELQMPLAVIACWGSSCAISFLFLHPSYKSGLHLLRWNTDFVWGIAWAGGPLAPIIYFVCLSPSAFVLKSLFSPRGSNILLVRTLQGYSSPLPHTSPPDLREAACGEVEGPVPQTVMPHHCSSGFG